MLQAFLIAFSYSSSSLTVYGRDLQTDITQDISRGFEDMAIEILKCEREQGDAVDVQLAKSDAYRLYKVDNIINSCILSFGKAANHNIFNIYIPANRITLMVGWFVSKRL